MVKPRAARAEVADLRRLCLALWGLLTPPQRAALRRCDVALDLLGLAPGHDEGGEG
jgi:hypothetical protein